MDLGGVHVGQVIPGRAEISQQNITKKKKNLVQFRNKISFQHKNKNTV